MFGAAACSIAVIEDDTEELIYIAAAGAGAAEIVGVHLPVGRGLGGWVAQSGQQIAVSDLRNDAGFARDVAEATNYVPSALMAVPIESDDRVLGVLTVLDRDAARAGADRDPELATAFAEQAAASIVAEAAFRSGGQVLLTALSRAAEEGTTLREVLADAVANPRHPSASRYCALLAELHQAGTAEQVLALAGARGRSALRARARRGITSALKPAWAEAFDPPADVAAGGIPVSAAWAYDGADGAGVRVAVVDSGIDYHYPAVHGPAAAGAALAWDPDEGAVATAQGAHAAPPADFGAPGIDLDVAWLGGATITATGNSFAAPHVSGLVARLLSKHPNMTPDEVKAVLRTVSRNVRS